MSSKIEKRESNKLNQGCDKIVSACDKIARPWVHSFLTSQFDVITKSVFLT